jgi:hypothetical protein
MKEVTGGCSMAYNIAQGISAVKFQFAAELLPLNLAPRLESVELYLCFPYMPSWRGQGRLCIFTYVLRSTTFFIATEF